MLTGRPSQPAVRRFSRRNPLDKKLLAKELRNFWGHFKPSTCPLAPFLVYEQRGFMNVENPSETLKQRLGGRALIDLGAGREESLMAMAHFAAALGVSEYVAVDQYVDYSGAEQFLNDWAGKGNIRIRAVNADLLLFLAGLPDGSANIVMNGIDECMLSGPTWATQYYRMLLGVKIADVVPPGGVAFGMNSPDLHALSAYGFEEQFERPGFVFTKG